MESFHYFITKKRQKCHKRRLKFIGNCLKTKLSLSYFCFFFIYPRKCSSPWTSYNYVMTVFFVIQSYLNFMHIIICVASLKFASNFLWFGVFKKLFFRSRTKKMENFMYWFFSPLTIAKILQKQGFSSFFKSHSNELDIHLL